MTSRKGPADCFREITVTTADCFREITVTTADHFREFTVSTWHFFCSRVRFDPSTSGRRHQFALHIPQATDIPITLREETHNLIPKPDLMITEWHIYSDIITRKFGFCTASALAGIHIYEVVMVFIASQKHCNDFEQLSLQIISEIFLV